MEKRLFCDVFPILGGRLLKLVVFLTSNKVREVSNPWREAIEETKKELVDLKKMVSNPWREAIEDCKNKPIALDVTRFQSLEGGY